MDNFNEDETLYKQCLKYRFQQIYRYLDFGVISVDIFYTIKNYIKCKDIFNLYISKIQNDKITFKYIFRNSFIIFIPIFRKTISIEKYQIK